MAVITYENVNPTLIPNTTMRIRLRDGVNYQYLVQAEPGYVLHDKALDCDNVDGMTGELINVILGYTRGYVTCAYTYDFTVNSREFYAVPENEVPADQIFGGVTPQPEVM